MTEHWPIIVGLICGLLFRLGIAEILDPHNQTVARSPGGRGLRTATGRRATRLQLTHKYDILGRYLDVPRN